MSTTVRIQAELDQALADKADSIYIESPEGVWLVVTNSGSAHVVARDSAHVVARDSAHVEARGSAHVVARDSAHVVAWESAHVVAWDSAHVEARDSAHVEAWESAHVVARDSAHVVARDSAHVEAWESAHVVAWDSAHVVASKYVAIHLYSQRVQIDGDGHLIDLTRIDYHDPAGWCDFHGVEVVDGIAYLYKAVNDDWKSGYGTSYAPGSTPEAADWNARRECGGGLHFCVRPALALTFNNTAAKFLKCGVRVDELVTLGDKVKAKRVVVPCVEVDRYGTVIEAVTS